MPPLKFGHHSPFDEDERATIDGILTHLEGSSRTEAEGLVAAIRHQLACLEGLGDVFSKYPSPLAEQSLGQRQRSLNTLVDILSRSNPANFDMLLPTRALLGRAIVMAEGSFWRMLGRICEDMRADDPWGDLAVQVSRRLRICLYTLLCEDVLTSIASDKALSRFVRSKAVVALAHIWEQRLAYRVADFFPLLEAAWEARQRTPVTGGTLMGTSEMLGLFQAGCDPKFVDYFIRPAHSEDELAAFREFLFGATTEELQELARRMESEGLGSVAMGQTGTGPTGGAGGLLYAFFRARHLQAMARRLAKLPGPQRTAEEYVMIQYLERMPEPELEGGPAASA